VNRPHIEPPREREQSLLPTNSTSGDASLSTNPILHGGQEVDNQTQDLNDEPMHPTLVVPDPSPRIRASNTVQSGDELLLACLQSFERNHASLASKMALLQGNVH
jgi:hypothetical protein